MEKKFYVTTPIYYVNARPHIGHVYTTVAADALARWHRMLGKKVFFLTGTDEHGSKIAAAAEESGVSPELLAGEMSGRFGKLWETLGISHDRFIKTTEPGHAETVRGVFLDLWRRGDIYRGTYEGNYCVACENYLSAADGDTCPDCRRNSEKLAEDTYFFRLSKYRAPLREFMAAHPEFVQPGRIRDEVENMLAGPLPDLSLTRRCNWGVGLPEETPGPGLTVYVWFDALLNYLSGLGYRSGDGDGEKFRAFWPPDIQLVGKDIIRFHHIIWPAILIAAGLPLPRTVFAHGWWLTGGEKMSKSRGNAADPEEYCRLYGAEALRYFLLAEVPFGIDGVFSEAAFRKRYNSDLANDLGNLIHRFCHLITTSHHGVIPPAGETPAPLAAAALDIFPELGECMDRVDFFGYLEKTRSVIAAGNLYMDEKAPWRGEADAPGVLYNLAELSRIFCIYLEPFLPATVGAIRKRLGITGLPSGPGALEWGRTVAGTRVSPGEPLFPRKK